MFRPLIASSLALALGASVAVANVQMTAGNDAGSMTPATITDATGALDWGTTGASPNDFYKPQYTPSSSNTATDIENLNFKFNGWQQNGITGSGSGNTYTATLHTGNTKFFKITSDKALQIGATGTGTLSVNMEDPSNTNTKRSFVLDLSQVTTTENNRRIAFKGNIKVDEGYANDGNKPSEFEAKFGGDMIGNIIIAKDGATASKDERKDFIFLNASKLQGNVELYGKVATLNFEGDGGGITGNITQSSKGYSSELTINFKGANGSIGGKTSVSQGKLTIDGTNLTLNGGVAASAGGTLNFNLKGQGNQFNSINLNVSTAEINLNLNSKLTLADKLSMAGGGGSTFIANGRGELVMQNIETGWYPDIKPHNITFDVKNLQIQKVSLYSATNLDIKADQFAIAQGIQIGSPSSNKLINTNLTFSGMGTVNGIVVGGRPDTADTATLTLKPSTNLTLAGNITGGNADNTLTIEAQKGVTLGLSGEINTIKTIINAEDLNLESGISIKGGADATLNLKGQNNVFGGGIGHNSEDSLYINAARNAKINLIDNAKLTLEGFVNQGGGGATHINIDGEKGSLVLKKGYSIRDNSQWNWEHKFNLTINVNDLQSGPILSQGNGEINITAQTFNIAGMQMVQNNASQAIITLKDGGTGNIGILEGSQNSILTNRGASSFTFNLGKASKLTLEGNAATSNTGGQTIEFIGKEADLHIKKNLAINVGGTLNMDVKSLTLDGNINGYNYEATHSQNNITLNGGDSVIKGDISEMYNRSNFILNGGSLAINGRIIQSNSGGWTKFTLNGDARLDIKGNSCNIVSNTCLNTIATLTLGKESNSQILFHKDLTITTLSETTGATKDNTNLTFINKITKNIDTQDPNKVTYTADRLVIDGSSIGAETDKKLNGTYKMAIRGDETIKPEEIAYDETSTTNIKVATIKKAQGSISSDASQANLRNQGVIDLGEKSDMTLQDNLSLVSFKYYVAETKADGTVDTTAVGNNTHITYFIDGRETRSDLQQSILSNIALSSTELYLANFNSLNKRMGELRDNNHSQGAWGRIFNGIQSNDANLKSSTLYTTVQAGYDYGFGLGEGVTNYLGFALSYGHSESEFKNKARFGRNFASIDSLKSDLVEFALYNSYVQDSGWYNDTVAKFSYLLNKVGYSGGQDATRTTSNKGDINTYAFTLSNEVGYRFKLGSEKEWFIDPQFELGMGHIAGTDFKDANFLASADSMFMLRTRLGASAGYDFKKLLNGNTIKASAYVGLFAEIDSFNGGDITFANLATQKSSFKSTDARGVINYGGNVAVKDNIRVYLDMEHSFGGQISTDYKINAGVRYSFGEKTQFLDAKAQEKKDEAKKKEEAPVKLKEEEKKNTQEQAKDVKKETKAQEQAPKDEKKANTKAEKKPAKKQATKKQTTKKQPAKKQAQAKKGSEAKKQVKKAEANKAKSANKTARTEGKKDNGWGWW